MGAGVLMVPGVITDLIALTVCLYLWLAQDESKQAHRFDTGGRAVTVEARQRRPQLVEDNRPLTTTGSH
jgi:UPF0716 family protein affecting phage T7 exclusion